MLILQLEKMKTQNVRLMEVIEKMDREKEAQGQQYATLEKNFKIVTIEL